MRRLAAATATSGRRPNENHTIPIGTLLASIIVSVGSRTTLINRYRHGQGGNAVGHYHEGTGSGLHSRGDVEVGGNDGIAGGDSHGAMAVRPGVENVTAGLTFRCNESRITKY